MGETVKRVVWKFPIPNQKEFIIEMPKGAQICTIQRWKDFPVFWAVVDPEADKEQRRFILVGTGHDFEYSAESNLRFLGTFQMLGGDAVNHLFEISSTGKILQLLPAKGETDSLGEATPTDPK